MTSQNFTNWEFPFAPLSQQFAPLALILPRKPTRILTPLVRQTDTNVKNSAPSHDSYKIYKFITKVLLVRFDLNSLFTKGHKILEVVAKNLEEDEILED